MAVVATGLVVGVAKIVGGERRAVAPLEVVAQREREGPAVTALTGKLLSEGRPVLEGGPVERQQSTAAIRAAPDEGGDVHPGLAVGSRVWIGMERPRRPARADHGQRRRRLARAAGRRRGGRAAWPAPRCHRGRGWRCLLAAFTLVVADARPMQALRGAGGTLPGAHATPSQRPAASPHATRPTLRPLDAITTGAHRRSVDLVVPAGTRAAPLISRCC